MICSDLLLQPHATCWSPIRITNRQVCPCFFLSAPATTAHLHVSRCWWVFCVWHVFFLLLCVCHRSALQVLHKACEASRRFNYFPGGIALTWMAFYESCITSEQSCVNEWNAMTDLETTRPDSPTMFVDRWDPSRRLLATKIEALCCEKIGTHRSHRKRFTCNTPTLNWMIFWCETHSSTQSIGLTWHI